MNQNKDTNCLECKKKDEEIFRLKQLISDEPECLSLAPAQFQRMWESCITLDEKAEFKFVFRYLHQLENEIKAIKTNLPK